ncbi:hypothetical protein KFD70_28950, partial [Bacillus pfraonensis]
QVKIRGFRIELGEIENKLLEHESIDAAAVIVKEKEEEKFICAYISSKRLLEDLDIRIYLERSLPYYMIPQYFIEMDNIPLTGNGKLDRKSLPEPDIMSNRGALVLPRNEIEESLSKIWSEVLGIENIGIDDNFFKMGGHSLKATVLVSKIHKELEKEIPLKELFRLPTIRELGGFISDVKESMYLSIEK